MEKQKGKKKLSDNSPQFWKKKPERIAKRKGVEVPNSFGNGGDESNLSGHQETNAEEKALGNVELGGPMTS